MASQFLFNQALWAEFAARIPKAKKVRGAVAYFGTGAAKLLPLREGDELVVDMSLGRVRAGGTDPNEIHKLIRRGVTVYSRRTLHAKFFIIDDVLIAGSSNISSTAQNVLDEAAILTDDRAAIIRARATFKDLCTEPVSKDYLAKCIAEHKSPKFGGKPLSRTPSKKTSSSSKLWLIRDHYENLPESEIAAANNEIEQVWNQKRKLKNSEVHYAFERKPPKYTEQLRPGTWMIFAVRTKQGFDVLPPVQFLGIKSIRDKTKRERFFIMFERPPTFRPISWPKFRGAASLKIPATPRTKPMATDADADVLLRLWDARGRFKKRK